VLVTGTDTSVGKTVVTAALAACLARSRTVAVVKLAQTGVQADEPGDIDEVRRLSGVHSLHEGIRLRDPLAPTTAARRQGISLPSMTDHAQVINDLHRSHDVVLVEGAGGLLVGIDGNGDGLRELARLLTVPHCFLVVTRASLGTLNHTRLTVEALRCCDLSVAGLVIGSYPQSPDLAEQTNLVDLPEVTGTPIVGQVPDGAGLLDPQAFQSLAPSWFQPTAGSQ
jgi:dethiobiotin synthetase